MEVSNEDRLRETLRKIEALYAAAGTQGVNRRGNGDRDRHIKGDHPGAVVLGDVGGGRSPEPASPRTTSSLAPTALSFGS